MATVFSVDETKQIDIDILRRLFSSATIGNCIKKEKHDEYRSNVIFEYSSDPEVLVNCDITVGIVRGLYSMDVNESYNHNDIIPFMLCLGGLNDDGKSWCQKFASEYIVDEYKDKFTDILNDLKDPLYVKSLYLNFYYMSEEEMVRDYYKKWQSLFRICILNSLNLIRFVTEKEKTERAIDTLMILIKDATILMIFDYIFKITCGIVDGTDVEDFVDKFNSFSEDNKTVAMRYIDRYFIASYREILYRKLKAGIHR